MDNSGASKEMLDEHFAESARLVDAALERLIPGEDVEPTRLHQAIRWSVFAGGKRFRPALMFAAGKALELPGESLLMPAAAVEMMHTFSLIHDDLPAMDDDDLRRGKATCHTKFDEATAILAGDALQSMAFGTIAEDESLDAGTRLKLMAGLAAAAGTPNGMVAGQQLDLDSENKAVDEARLEMIHTHKTGALITFSAVAAATVGAASDDVRAAISEYSARLGLLFQITDDILDVTQSADVLGKTAGKDRESQKTTYPSIYGLAETKNVAARTCDQAIAAIEPLGPNAFLLAAIARRTLHRTS